MRAASAAGRRGVEPGKRFLRGAERDFLLAAFLPALLGFENEAAAPIEIDPAVPGLARFVAKRDSALEHVIVVFVRRIGRIGPR